MKLFILGCIIFLGLVIITALLRMRKPQQAATRRRPREDRHTMETNYHSSSSDVEAQDPDLVLGLKQPATTVNTSDETTNSDKPCNYIVLHVMALNNHPYGGYELLQSLLANGLRYSAQDKIFHGYLQNSDHVIFSLASVNQPGTFDLPNMNQFYCPGLTLFMEIKKADQANDFEQMLAVAHQLADDLGGEVWGEDRQPLNTDAIYWLRQRFKSLSLETA